MSDLRGAVIVRVLSLLAALLFASPVSAGTFKYPGGGSSATFDVCFCKFQGATTTGGDFAALCPDITIQSQADGIDATGGPYFSVNHPVPVPPNGGTWTLESARWYSGWDDATMGIAGADSLKWRLRYANEAGTNFFETNTGADVIFDAVTYTDADTWYSASVSAPMPSGTLTVGLSNAFGAGQDTQGSFHACFVWVER